MNDQLTMELVASLILVPGGIAALAIASNKWFFKEFWTTYWNGREKPNFIRLSINVSTFIVSLTLAILGVIFASDLSVQAFINGFVVALIATGYATGSYEVAKSTRRVRE